MPPLTTAKRFLAASLVLACPLLAGFFVFKPKMHAPDTPPVRLVRATLVAPTPPRWSEVQLSGHVPYQWYTQKAFLYGGQDEMLTASNIVAGKSDILTNISHSYHDVGGDMQNMGGKLPYDWLLSPDRRWLLTYIGDPRHRHWSAMSLDGKRHVSFPARFPFQPMVCWKGDSSGWIELFQGTNGPAVAMFNIVPSAVPNPITPLPLFRGGFFARPEVLGGIGRSSFVVAIWGEDDRHRVPLFIYRAGDARGEPKRLGVAIPRQAHMMEAEMSSDGRRIAWVFIVPNVTHRGFHLPFFKSNAPEMDQQLWISDVDGEGMRRIAAADPQGKEELRAIHYVRWLPDGKSVSFVDGPSLYTAPAN